MKITDTKIPNVTEENIDESKLNLVNKIIQNISPLLDEVYEDNLKVQKILQDDLKSKKLKVLQSKEILENLIKEYDKKKKTKKLVQRLSKLITSGLTFDGTLKHETVILLKIVNKLSNEKLNYHLSETMRLINKRFSRNI